MHLVLWKESNANSRARDESVFCLASGVRVKQEEPLINSVLDCAHCLALSEAAPLWCCTGGFTTAACSRAASCLSV